MSKSTLDFEMAQLIRESHCDRKGDEGHTCVGSVTIKRGEVCLDCPLCGKGEQRPGWSTFIANRLDMIFHAAGIKWDCLALDVQLAAIRKYVELHETTKVG